MSEVICKIEKKGNRLIAIDVNTKIEHTSDVNYGRRRDAFEKGKYLQRKQYKDGRSYWRMVDSKDSSTIKSAPVVKGKNKLNETVNKLNGSANVDELKKKYKGICDIETEHDKFREFLSTAYSRKPKNLIMNELHWKAMVRAGLRGGNILLSGYSGCGKTKSAHSLGMSLERPYFKFNLGSMTDARASLIGNTFFENNETIFHPSEFVTAITTPYAVILMDEISRLHPDAENILMTVFDPNERYLRLDESKGDTLINVAEGVTFITTANIGQEFTSTRLIDRATVDRFTWIEVPLLNSDQELKLLQMEYPNVDNDILTAIATVANDSRINHKSDDPKIDTIISTRMSERWAEHVYDGFTFYEAAEIVAYPFFEDGDMERGRGFIKKSVNKFSDMTNYSVGGKELEDLSENDNLFDATDTTQ